MGSKHRHQIAKKSQSKSGKSAKLSKLALARQARHEPQVEHSLPRTRANAIENTLFDTREELAEARTQLSAHQQQVLCLRSDLSEARSSRAELQSLQAQVAVVSDKSDARLKLLQNTRRKLERANKQVHELKYTTLPAAVQRANRAESDFTQLWKTTAAEITRLKSIIEQQAADITALNSQLKCSRKKIRALQRRCSRAPGTRARTVARALHAAARKSSTFKLCENGAVNQEVRQMARALVKAGCGQAHVSTVIKQISAGIGVTVTGNISRRTVGRSILEGGIAAELQLAHEIKQTDSKFNTMAIPLYY